jgi:hypothetical protein
MLAVCDCLLNVFTATLHIGGRSSPHNLRMCHAMVTVTHLLWGDYHNFTEMFQVSGRAAHLFILFGIRKSCLNSRWCQSVLLDE